MEVTLGVFNQRTKYGYYIATKQELIDLIKDVTESNRALVVNDKTKLGDISEYYKKSFVIDPKDIIAHISKITITTDGEMGYKNRKVYTLKGTIKQNLINMLNINSDTKLYIKGIGQNFETETYGTCTKLIKILHWYL